MRQGPNGAGLSRKAIMTEIDASLRRLGIDYVDLYQIHRWDYATPIEETMEALHDVVKAGKARYIGASSMYAWQFAKALYVAERARLDAVRQRCRTTTTCSIARRSGRCCRCARDQGVGVIPWSPLARGRLTRDWDESDGAQRDRRVRQDAVRHGQPRDRRAGGSDRRGPGVSRAQVALAWVAGHPTVTAPIIGATKPQHLDDAIASVGPRADGGREGVAGGAVHTPAGERPRVGRDHRRA